ncbi:MAG TPA: hypothetical protein PLY87_26525 [Planctomycetaceae bacterium]|nr:hypothetical protein [Planctomycetaceae bacterium]
MWKSLCTFLKRNGSSRRRSGAWTAPEQLECRMLPTGHILAVVRCGNLIVHGDNVGADIEVSQIRAGQITLTGHNTTINGSMKPMTFSNVTRDLRINLGSGNDSVAFNESTPIKIRGNLSVQGGHGDNQVSTISGSPGSLNVGGQLTIVNLQAGTSLTTLYNINVNGDVKIVNQGGNCMVAIDVNSQGYDLPPQNTIRGNLKIVNGGGDIALVNLQSLDVRGSVYITNSSGTALVEIGGHDPLDSHRHSKIAGGLQIVNGPGLVSQVGIRSIDVRRNVYVRNEGHDMSNAIFEASIIGGSVAVTNLSGQRNQTHFFETDIGQNLRVKEAGPGNSFFAFQSSNVRGTTHLWQGNGENTVYFANATFGRRFQARTGGGNDMLGLGTTRFDFGYEQRYGVVAINDEGAINIEQRSETRAATVAAGSVTFNGRVRINLGSGDDTLELATGAKVTFRKFAKINGRKGQNTANINHANVVNSPKLRHF